MQTDILVTLIRSIFAVIVYSIMFRLLVKRHLEQHEEYQEWNLGRFFIILSMIGIVVNPILRILGVFNLLGDSPFLQDDSSSFTLLTLFVGFCIAALFMFAFYVNNWENIQYMPLFYFLGCIWIYISLGMFIFLSTLNSIGGLFALFMINSIGIKVKDNNTLGLGIFFTITFASVLVYSNFILATSLNIIALIFGLVYANDKFNWYKEESDESDEANVEYSEKESSETSIIQNKSLNSVQVSEAS